MAGKRGDFPGIMAGAVGADVEPATTSNDEDGNQRPMLTMSALPPKADMNPCRLECPLSANSGHRGALFYTRPPTIR